MVGTLWGCMTRIFTLGSGGQFTTKEFVELVWRFLFRHIRIRWYHSASNWLVERFNRSTREAVAEHGPRIRSQARGLLGKWVQE